MFSAKRVPETVVLTFDFSALTPSVSGSVVAVVRDSREPDAAPLDIVLGTKTEVGGKVLQVVSGGSRDTHYKFSCTVNANDGVSIYTLEEVLPVL